MPDRNPMSAEAWWGRVDACRKVRRDYFSTWQDNVSYRRGKPFKSTPHEDTVNVPADWSRTKNKQSQLFYQIPEVILRARRPEWTSVANVFGAALNFELTEKVQAEHMMNECLSDVINAAGVMICMVSFEASFEDVPMPMEEPQAQPPELPPSDGFADLVNGPGGAGGGLLGALGSGGGTGTSGSPSPDVTVGDVPDAEMPQTGVVEGEVMPEETMVPRTVYQCYKADRVSPAHFVWPIEFVGTNWQKASFLGREGYLPVAEAIRRNWVPAGTEGVQISESEWLLIRDTTDTKPADSFVKFVELFTRPHTYDPKEKDPRKIRRIVLVESGKEGNRAKVVDEDFKWQKRDPKTGRWVGMTDFPIKVATIAHISDLAIPPSDSEIGRPQVRELIKSRTQMIRQRDHSMPLRWFDVNLVDPIIGDRMRRGKWQDMIPMNGPGDHAIGEVARASYPAENWNFDRTIKADLDESWSMGANQQGLNATGETTATEVREVKGANDIRLEYERQWVLRFFLEVAQSVGQLMQLFADDEDYAYVVGEDGKATLQQWNKDIIAGEYVFSVRPDSQLRLDVNQRRLEGLNLYKLLRKDPVVDPAVLVRRVLEDHGIDPAKALAKPQEPKKEKPKISGSFKGEDMVNPVALALINKSDTPITAEDIKAAKDLIASVMAGDPLAGDPNAAGLGAVDPKTQEHGGPAPKAENLDRRYEKSDTRTEGSRDSSLPAMK